MMKKSNNIPYIIIIALLIVVLIERCHKEVDIPQKPTIITRIDTLTVRDTITKVKPKWIKGDSIPYAEWDTVYIPDTTYNGVKKQYLEAITKFLTKNYYSDTLHINKDSLFGWLVVKDTVQKNLLQGRTYSYNLSYTQKTTTIITPPPPPTRQLYIGGMITGNPTDVVSGAHLGILYKDRKDVIFGGHIGITDKIQYGISIYQKIKLK
jgi:hypothetical protein